MDNTSDANKPISTLVQSALDNKAAETALNFSQSDTYVATRIQSRLLQEVWATDAPFSALGNGVFNSTAAIQAAVDLLASRGGGTVRLPAGNFICGTINRKANVTIQGAGKQATRLIAPSGFNASMFASVGSISGSVSWGGLRDLTIVGSGRTNSAMVGIDHRWTNRAMVRDVDIFGCRKGMYIENVWQDLLDNVHVHGGGTDQSYIGFHLGPKDSTQGISNAVIATNCVAQNVEAYGFRLENYDGSKFTSCEGMNGIHGWYLGDPSTGTEACQFGHFINCLADTNSGHNWRIEKGAASDIRQAQFANCWAGTSTGGDNVYVGGASQLVFTNWQAVAANKNAFRFYNSSRCTVSMSSLRDYNKSAQDSCGVLLENSAAVKIIGNQVYTQSTGTGTGIKETGNSNYNDISNNNLPSPAVTLGANSQSLNNIII